ncbi:hypothetical protein GN956_G11510 [Arapaima gigas]
MKLLDQRPRPLAKCVRHEPGASVSRETSNRSRQQQCGLKGRSDCRLLPSVPRHDIRSWKGKEFASCQGTASSNCRPTTPST